MLASCDRSADVTRSGPHRELQAMGVRAKQFLVERNSSLAHLPDSTVTIVDHRELILRMDLLGQWFVIPGRPRLLARWQPVVCRAARPIVVQD